MNDFSWYEEIIDERTLPVFIQHDIKELVKARQEEKTTGKTCLHMDCLENELYGSINAAYYDKLISKQEGEYLRKKYLKIDIPLENI